MKTGLPWAPFALALLHPLLVAEADRPTVDALAIEAAYLQVAEAEEWWPGFSPAEVPLAIYDGADSYLFRHPHPGTGWNELPRESHRAESRSLKGHALAGRHPGLVAHTNTEIDGTPTATLFFDGSGEPPATARACAAIALHEAFHVFQREHFPNWNPNEALLFTYPVEDPEALFLRRLEGAAWQQAAKALDAADREGWIRTALSHRETRFARLAREYVDYEAKLELLEGLAAYVQERAEGRSLSDATIPRDGFPATAVRLRSYRVGALMAHLLDLQAPAWRHTPAAEFPFLHELLARSLPGGASPTERRLPDEVVAEIRQRAESDLVDLARDRLALRERFFDEAPFLIHLAAPADQPLWPRGFDPMNVTRVDGGILHSRMLMLGNEQVGLEMLKAAGAPVAAITAGAGAHPLFNGVSEVWIRVPQEPVIDAGAEGTTLTTTGLALRLTGEFEIARAGRVWRIRRD